MAKIIDMPTTPNFISSNFRLRRYIGAAISPYTGSLQTQEYDGVFWEAEVTLPPMRRDLAVNWQSFLMELNGPVNTFKFADPDALTMRGTHNASQGGVKGQQRVNETNIQLSFTASSNTITAASGTPFANALVGDFIMVTGSSKAANNGTHKITSKTNATTIIVDPVDYESLVDDSNVSGCTIRQNVKGIKGLTLVALGNSASGTILKGDYLGISASTSNAPTTYTPVQYVLATSDALETNNGSSALNQYSVRIEPKLRTSFTNTADRVYHTPAKGLFRLVTKEVEWSADQISNYGISFSCQEVI